MARKPGATIHSLVCGIGGQGPSDLFFVGGNATSLASRSGSSFRGMNEQSGQPGAYADNRGSWTVSISVR